MKNPLLLLSRGIALGCRRNRSPHAITPLSRLKRVVLIYDPAQGDSQLEKQIKDFFAQAGLELILLKTQRSSLNLIGQFKRRLRKQSVLGEQDLFISLISDPDNFASKYESKFTRAGFRIGCQDMGEQVYDLRFSIPRKDMDQGKVFAEIADFLTKIV